MSDVGGVEGPMVPRRKVGISALALRGLGPFVGVEGRDDCQVIDVGEETLRGRGATSFPDADPMRAELPDRLRAGPGLSGR